MKVGGVGIGQAVVTRVVEQRKRMNYDRLARTIEGRHERSRGRWGGRRWDEMSSGVVEVKDIYDNQTKTMQARSATNAR